MSQEHEQIAMRAYQIWEEAGRPEGLALEHWRLASAEFVAGQPHRVHAPGRNPSEDASVDDSIAGARDRSLRRSGLRDGLTPTKRARILARRYKIDG